MNGIGTTLMGLRRTNERGDPNVGHATTWFTFAFLPIVPLKRLQIRIARKERKGSGVAFHELGRSTLHIGEIVLTYLTGWIVWPALLFAPPILTGAGAGESAWALIWFMAFGPLAFGWREYRYRYVSDPRRERITASLTRIQAVLRGAGVDSRTGEMVTRIGYLLAASMIAADGEVNEEELVVATIIGTRMFPDFSQAEFNRVVAARDRIPAVGLIGEVLHGVISTEGRTAIVKYLRAIAASDGAVDEREEQLILSLERAWSSGPTPPSRPGAETTPASPNRL